MKAGGNVIFTKDHREIKGGQIHCDDIWPTLKYLAWLIDGDAGQLWQSTLGSVGKTEVSNDIDIALDKDDCDFDDLVHKLGCKIPCINVNRGLRQINLLLPIQGKYSASLDAYNGMVQVDLFYGKKRWMQFSYASAGDKSDYKGVWRAILLSSVTNTKTQFTDYWGDELIAKVGEVFDMNNGIITQCRIRQRKKRGTGYVKHMKSVLVSDSEWQERYGHVPVIHRHIDEPEQAAQYLFGDDTSVNELESFEGVLNRVKMMSDEEQKLVEHVFKLKSGYTFKEVPTK